MPIHLLIEGVLIGFVVAVPVGPLALLCINRALSMGAILGFFSGLGVASGDALAAGIAALGISLVSTFLADHQLFIRLVGGGFLCYVGFKIYKTTPSQQALPGKVNGLFGAYATAFFLTISNPATILSFFAIYAGWGVETLAGHYFAAAILALGVFIGSGIWWVALFVGVTLFRHKFSVELVGWIHRVSGAVIAGFGFIVLLSLSPLKNMLGIQFNTGNRSERGDGP
jgi:threonine/homoserine/homoserine lactone efflux protein